MIDEGFFNLNIPLYFHLVIISSLPDWRSSLEVGRRLTNDIFIIFVMKINVNFS